MRFKAWHGLGCPLHEELHTLHAGGKMMSVCALDPNGDFVAGNDAGDTGVAQALCASILNRGCERMSMFISAPSLTARLNASRNRPRGRP